MPRFPASGKKKQKKKTKGMSPAPGGGEPLVAASPPLDRAVVLPQSSVQACSRRSPRLSPARRLAPVPLTGGIVGELDVWGLIRRLAAAPSSTPPPSPMPADCCAAHALVHTGGQKNNTPKQPQLKKGKVRR